MSRTFYYLVSKSTHEPLVGGNNELQEWATEREAKSAANIYRGYKIKKAVRRFAITPTPHPYH